MVASMRILIADQQPRVRFALRVLLKREPGLEVVGEAVNADELLAQTAAISPDLVLLGWELPHLTPGVLSTLRQACPALAVVALSGRPEARGTALEAGVNGFVSKTDLPERLLAAIHKCDGQACNADQIRGEDDF